MVAVLGCAQIGPGVDSIEQRLLKMSDDPDPRVRFQLALTLGELRAPGKIQSLAQIARRDAADPWVRTAILSSVNQDAIDLFDALSADPGSPSSAMASLSRELTTVIGSRLDRGEIVRA